MTIMTGPAAPLILGPLAEVELTAFGARLHARVDTGAATSALDAEAVRVEGERVSFVLRGDDGPVPCEAALIGRRTVRSSNGAEASRVVIETEVRIGDRRARIEAGLADRSAMSRRMILGRQALAALGALVDCGREDAP